jgi:large subunit ribosomal protein L2
MFLKKFINKLKYKYISSNGRNFQGIKTIGHKGGGFKQKYIIIDNKKFLFNIPAILIKIFTKSIYRNKYYGLFLYNNGLLFINILTLNLNIGSIIINTTNNNYKLNTGSSTIIKNIEPSIFINNLELQPGKGSQFCKTSGNYCFIINKYLTFKTKILIKLKKKTFYLLHSKCLATLGINYFLDPKKKKVPKAGINRWLNKKPIVRGVAMNPIDHPHGGGQGKTSGGRCSVSPWSILTKGKKTRKKKNKFFIKYL